MLRLMNKSGGGGESPVDIKNLPKNPGVISQPILDVKKPHGNGHLQDTKFSPDNSGDFFRWSKMVQDLRKGFFRFF